MQAGRQQAVTPDARLRAATRALRVDQTNRAADRPLDGRGIRKLSISTLG